MRRKSDAKHSLSSDGSIKWNYQRWLNVYEELIGHTGAMIIVLTSFWLIEVVFHLFWGHERLLFGLVPFNWAVDAADLFAFIAFSYAGTVSSIRAYKGEQ